MQEIFSCIGLKHTVAKLIPTSLRRHLVKSHMRHNRSSALIAGNGTDKETQQCQQC